MLSAYSSEQLWTNAFVLWILFFEKHLILDVKGTHTTKASLRKFLDIKNKGCKCYYKISVVSGTSEKIVEKLDDVIKEQPDDLIVRVGTNDLTNNVHLLTNV